MSLLDRTGVTRDELIAAVRSAEEFAAEMWPDRRDVGWRNTAAYAHLLGQLGIDRDEIRGEVDAERAGVTP